MDFYKALLYNCTERTNGSMALNDPPLSSPIMRTVLFIFSSFFLERQGVFGSRPLITLH